MSRNEFVINGKFLLAALEGMPRVGREVTEAMDALLDEMDGVKVSILAPRGASNTISLKNIPIKEVGSHQGLLWEQIDLPLNLKGRFCLNFTGTAPVLLRNGCVVVHDAQFITARKSHGWRSALLYNIITPAVARRYRTIATVSEYARQEILDNKVCSREDIKIIFNGVDHTLRRHADTAVFAKHALIPGEFLLSNSYVHAHKNVPILFDAVRNDPQLAGRLVLFGSSGKSSFEACGINVPAGVRFLGRITDGELVALMSAARIFLFPSTTEGFGLPPLEAMQLGCPTICSNAGAMPEVCGDGALFASAHDAADWRAKICMLWDDEGQRALLSAAGKRRAAGFTWTNAAKSYLDICLNA
jgi:glycosyltransferase involved in cell wall biosynthesis